MDYPDPMTDLVPLPVTHRAVIPDEYRDEMGHMNVMWYTHLFAESTRRVFIEFGMTPRYFADHHAGSFALEAHTRFLAEVRTADRITVRCRVLGRSAKLFHVMHFLIRDDDSRLCATEESIGAHIDMSTRRTSPFPAEVAARIDAWLLEHSRLPWPAPVCGVMHP